MQTLLLRSLKAYTIFSLTCAMLFVTGCEDDDHDNHDEGHTDADGFILENEKYRDYTSDDFDRLLKEQNIAYFVVNIADETRLEFLSNYKNITPEGLVGIKIYDLKHAE